MKFFLICVLAAGAEVSATSLKKQPPGCPFPSGPPDCGPNAYFEVCSYACPIQNCSTLWTKYSCKQECCKPECRCKDGFLRDDKTGLCIDRDECFAPCGPLERFVRCGTKCRETCANYKVSAPQSMCKPFTGCICMEGWVRLNDDATGPCVLPKQCPSRRCPIHEHWEECPNVCLNETCISRSSDFKCLLPAIPLPCKSRCICDEGYLRNHLGMCIPEIRCPVKKCSINEVWRCASPCAHDSCKWLEPGFKCLPGVVSVCIPACVCKDGYLRNDRGVCIPRELCPASLRCSINEVAVQCATEAPRESCESVYTVYPYVDAPCSPGCDCRPGYLRNKLSICVPIEFCPTVPPNKCGANQEFRKYGSACEPSCADLNGPSEPCAETCTTGCFCKDGYLKDGQGSCIPRDECPLPVCTQPNEVAKDCGSYCEMRTCNDYKWVNVSCATVCVRGCFCLDGYVRNAYGVCVQPKQCPPEPICLQANEEYLSCGPSCPDTCDNYRDTGRVCTANCVSSCFCKAGYVRNPQDNACVKPEKCPSKECTGLNEDLNPCASYCPVTCRNRLTLADWSCIALCRQACDCIPGTLRADNGTCVPVHQCTPPVCRENEKYMQCGPACPLSCDNYKSPPACTDQCIEDCFCADGYVRDRNMRCVKPENCEPICPAGEKYSECSAHCQDTCENYNVTNRVCSYQWCQSGCVCDSGTVRSKDGLCVRPSQCSIPTCPADEVFDECSAHCEPTYEDHGPDRPCIDICKPGCKCRHPLVRRSDGKCVKLNNCVQICPPGEKLDECYAHCQDTCENYNVTNRPCTHQCQSGCVCDTGTVRRKDGQCVPPSDCCFPMPTCPIDEVFDKCSAHCEPTCEDHGPDRPCIDICKPGCKCRYPLVRRSDGKCVKLNNCVQICPPGEKLDECYAHCQDTCENYNVTNRPCTHQCQSGCVCDTGTVRRKDGQCVPPSDCCFPMPTCPVDEVFDKCSAHCEPTCEDHGPDRPCIDICKPGCKCRHPLVRRSDGKCVKLNNCVQICPPGEKLDVCYAHCQDTCENYNVTNRPCTHQCQSGCVCDTGTVRRKDGQCVPPSDCCFPMPTCPVDEVFDKCSAHCEPTCEDHGPDRPCIDICKPGCKCRHPLVRRSDGKCVKLNNCVQICPPGEKLDVCYAHCQDTCENYNVTNRPCTHQCQSGCVCDTGTVRRKDGQCVPPSDCCFPMPTCPVDEVFDKCSAHCEPTCEDHGPDRPCIDICKPGCKCRHPLVRRSDGKCVKLNNCVQICPPGEKLDVCYAHCQDTCENYNVTNRPRTHQCQSGCVCDTGTVRRKDGQCVPPSDCCFPMPTCPVDEVFDKCSAHCEPTCEDHGPDRPCIDICKPGCKCRHPLVRRSDGKCVKLNNCVQICPPGEKLDVCYAHCQDTCENYNVTNRPRTHQCQSGCVCDTGTVRRKDGQCVPPSDCCFPMPTCPVDEVFDKCSAHCEPTCEDHGPDRPCIDICKPGCKCRYPLVRRSDGKCVKLNNCVQICPPGEKLDECYAHCQDTCENYNVTNRPCTHQCQSGCVCDTGTVRRKDGQCVPPSDCCFPMPTCPVDEVFDKCSAHCEPTCEDHGPDRPCIDICKPGCKCRYPLVRRSDGKCVKLNNCVQICPPGEKFDECYAHCQDTCENYNVTNRPCTHQCQSGCVCDTGTVRRKDGQCVPPSDCCFPTPTCPVDEVFDKCSAHCEPTCEDHGPDRPCIDICKPGCKCRYPLVRRSDGKCVKLNNCVQICPPGEKPDECYAHCQDTCENYNVTNRPCTHQCQSGCVCDTGTVRRKDGQCVPPSDCCFPMPTCPVDEVFDKCSAHCEPTCEDHGPDRPCIDICKPGCKCRYPLVRRSDGKCVKLNNCVPICPPGEKLDECYAHCQDTCENYNVTNRPCTHQCQSGCVCDTGTVRRKDGHCVPPCDCCFPMPTCPVDEVFDKCSAHCEPTCEDHGPDWPCIDICKPGCKCRHPLVRRSDGKCVKLNNCATKSCGPNEHYEKDRIKCELNCKNFKLKAIMGPCKPASGCFCNDCYARDTRGVCIRQKQCPIPKTCPPNEVLANCFNPCQMTCKTRLRSDGKVCHLDCRKSSCLCIDGYLRHDNGTCVPISQCSLPRCNANETYSNCGSACPLTCATRGNTCSVCTQQCVEDCFCAVGLVRAEDGACIAPEDCPPRTCNDANEVFVECPPSCPPGDKCSNMWSKYDCSKYPDCCDPQCRCKSGYARNKKGKCVTTQQCIHGE